MPQNDLLAKLNSSQKAAVSSVADTLAILAGPGSGKTHTITSRTAWLLQQGLQPWNIIVATFTVKAAREMKERIGKLIGNGLESKLVLGTFHSIARRYLARYGHLINTPKDFGIADSADSVAIIKRIVKVHKMSIDPKVARSRISSHKSRGPDHAETKAPPKKSVETQEFETCYIEYEAALQRSNLLDYDDLLLRCVDLLRSHPSCVENVEAVLIDELQDTNLVQFDLMRLFAAHRKRITVVGDPDQSIYGFRAAETRNYKRMIAQYPDTVTIPLEENYRSSGSILLTALSVIEQDTSRISKSLMPTHTVGTRPVFRKLSRAQKEAEWIVTEIKRCTGMTGDLLGLNDFAILLRSAALSRLIESELGKAGLQYRMVGGLRFYDGVEVKTVLDYLRVIEQPGNNDALARIINVPSRGIGETTIKALLEEADTSRITLWMLILGAVQGTRSSKTKLRPQAEKGLSKLVNIVLTVRKKLDSDTDKGNIIVDSIKLLLEKTDYEEWLRDHHNDAHKARWANVQELITQASDFQDRMASGSEDDSLPAIDGLEQMDASDSLSRFLANLALASHVEKAEEEHGPIAQITISTIHAAKGLEWPVVFVPAAYQGSIPHSRAEDPNEERRLLYVAMTRAQALLYMSCPLKNSQGEQATISPFLTDNSLIPLLDQKGPSFQSSTIQSISQILRRPQPSSKSILIGSADLPSQEDDLFGVGEAEYSEESKWDRRTGDPHFTMGQQPAKRRRVDIGGTTDDKAAMIGDRMYETTMEKASGFMSASTTLSSTFVTAGTHLQAVGKLSITRNSDALHSFDQGQPPIRSKTTSKTASKPAIRRSDGQGTLLGFLGKAEPKVEKRPAFSPKPNLTSLRRNPNFSSAAIPAVKPGQARRLPSPTRDEVQAIGISPSLAKHRLGLPPRSHVAQAGHLPGRGRPKPFPFAEHDDNDRLQRRNDYCFLSSSSTKPNETEIIKEQVVTAAEARSKDELELSLPSIGVGVNEASQGKDRAVRPAAVLHPTSMSMMLQGQGSSSQMKRGKTLGMRSTVSKCGWANVNRAFVPPPMKR